MLVSDRTLTERADRIRNDMREGHPAYSFVYPTEALARWIYTSRMADAAHEYDGDVPTHVSDDIQMDIVNKLNAKYVVLRSGKAYKKCSV